MFSGFMVNAWIVATIVGAVGGAVGFFVVLRGAAFVAHAVPNGSFAGAAAASLIGISTLIGLGVFSLAGALGIGLLGRRGRQDVAVALTLVFMLGLGALFLSFNAGSGTEIYSVLFGEILGVSTSELVPTLALGAASLAALALVYRPLLLSSVLPEAGRAQGISPLTVELCFLVVVALVTTMTVPVVGTALIFSVMIGPPAAARAFTTRPPVAIALSVAIALAVVWAAIALSYQTNWPVGFFVGALSAAAYACGRSWAFWRSRRRLRAGAYRDRLRGVPDRLADRDRVTRLSVRAQADHMRIPMGNAPSVLPLRLRAVVSGTRFASGFSHRGPGLLPPARSANVNGLLATRAGRPEERPTRVRRVP